MGSNEEVIMEDDIPTFPPSLPVPNVQEMVRKDPCHVPERYLRTQDETLMVLVEDKHSSRVPVIDLSLIRQGDNEELHKLDVACKDWGFFQIINHGVPEEVMQKTKNVIAEFFELSIEDKNKFKQPPNDLQGYGHGNVASMEQKLDWFDALLLVAFPKRFRRHKVWPTTPDNFSEIVDSYSSEVRRVAEELLGSLSSIMGLGKEALPELHGELAQALRAIYYPTCSKPAEVLGMSPHSDSCTITILSQCDDTSGLQIQHDGKWVPVKPIPNALVVNVGDMVEIWSNGRYKSVEHRVVTNMEKPRISIASFVYPLDDVEVKPLEQMIDPQKPLKMYKKVKYGEYLRHSMQRKMEGKAHTEIARMK